MSEGLGKCTLCGEPGGRVACDGNPTTHIGCPECAARYLRISIMGQKKVPTYGEHIPCWDPDCDGQFDLSQLIQTMPPDDRKRVREQIARSTINKEFDKETAMSMVVCDHCGEMFVRNGPTDACGVCREKGKLSEVYVASPPQPAADAETERLIQQTCTACRKCGANINRISGCNHMKCSNCGHQFCYICGGDFNVGAPAVRCTSFRCAHKSAGDAERRREEVRRRSRLMNTTCNMCMQQGVTEGCVHKPLALASEL